MIIVERITAEAMPYSVLNLLGQEVITGVNTGERVQINLAELQPTICFLKIGKQLIEILKQ